MTLATYASLPENSRGRLYPDFPNIMRSPYQRDRDRLIHSAAFRRLDGKTQVFAYHEGKNYRTRLTHSIEVAQITRTLCKALNLNEDLGEAIALAHDLGHSPFGHAGERGLNNAMRRFGGFDHNVQSLKIMTKLERHYPAFDGLNLTWETLEGTVKHNGPLAKIGNSFLKGFNKSFNLDLKHFPSLEAQIASCADDIAYNNHDVDDGFRAGFFSLEELSSLPFVAQILDDCRRQYPAASDDVRIYAVTRSLIAAMVYDLLDNTRANLKKHRISTNEEIRRAPEFIAGFSPEMKKQIAELHLFLVNRFYTATNIVRMDMKSTRLVEELFNVFMNDWKLLPAEQRARIDPRGKEAETAEVVCEYIASMTDMAALEEHQKLFDIHTRF